MLHNLGRETFLAPVTWDENGWPVVGYDGTIELEMDAPILGKILPVKNVWRDDFERNKLDLNWNFVRNPKMERYNLSYRKGWLHMNGHEETLSEAKGSPTFIGKKQQDFNCTASTRISIESRGKNSEAGITAYYNDSYHYEVFIAEDNGRYYVGLRKRVHDIEVITDYIPVEYHDYIDLRIRADKQYYYFEYKLPENEWKFVGKGMTAGLCTEGTYTMTFTGTYLGIYCVNGIAYFDWFEYTEENKG
jgi:hypothetical protein